MKKVVPLVIMLFCASCSSQMDNYDSSGQLYQRGSHYAKDISSKKDNQSMGTRYLLGEGTPADDKKAFKYFKKAAREDNPFAQNELGYLYAAGKGTKQDLEEAVYWYQKAAAKGLSTAEYNLGLMYAKGLGVQANAELAKLWLQKSASQGFTPATRALKQFSHESNATAS